MRKYLFITLIVFSCNSDYKGKKVNNAPSNFVTFEIYPSDNIAIRLPSKCTLIDSTSFGQRKTIISNKIIYSEDSSISLFILEIQVLICLS